MKTIWPEKNINGSKIDIYWQKNWYIFCSTSFIYFGAILVYICSKIGKYFGAKLIYVYYRKIPKIGIYIWE